MHSGFTIPSAAYTADAMLPAIVVIAPMFTRQTTDFLASVDEVSDDAAGSSGTDLPALHPSQFGSGHAPQPQADSASGTSDKGYLAGTATEDSLAPETGSAEAPPPLTVKILTGKPASRRASARSGRGTCCGALS